MAKQPTSAASEFLSWHHQRHPTHKPSASRLRKLTDRPYSTLPDQIYNLSAGKHAGGLEVGEPSRWSRYNNRCSVCSTWAHFTLQHTAESIRAPRWKTRGSPTQSSVTLRGNQSDRSNKTATYDAPQLVREMLQQLFQLRFCKRWSRISPVALQVTYVNNGHSVEVHISSRRGRVTMR